MARREAQISGRHPAQPVGAGAQAVLTAEGPAAARAFPEGGQHPLPIVRVQELRPEIGIGRPVRARVAEDRFSLGTAVDGGRVHGRGHVEVGGRRLDHAAIHGFVNVRQPPGVSHDQSPNAGHRFDLAGRTLHAKAPIGGPSQLGNLHCGSRNRRALGGVAHVGAGRAAGRARRPHGGGGRHRPQRRLLHGRRGSPLRRGLPAVGTRGGGPALSGHPRLPAGHARDRRRGGRTGPVPAHRRAAGGL